MEGQIRYSDYIQNMDNSTRQSIEEVKRYST